MTLNINNTILDKDYSQLKFLELPICVIPEDYPLLTPSNPDEDDNIIYNIEELNAKSPLSSLTITPSVDGISGDAIKKTTILDKYVPVYKSFVTKRLEEGDIRLPAFGITPEGEMAQDAEFFLWINRHMEKERIKEILECMHYGVVDPEVMSYVYHYLPEHIKLDYYIAFRMLLWFGTKEGVLLLRYNHYCLNSLIIAFSATCSDQESAVSIVLHGMGNLFNYGGNLGDIQDIIKWSVEDADLKTTGQWSYEGKWLSDQSHVLEQEKKNSAFYDPKFKMPLGLAGKFLTLNALMAVLGHTMSPIFFIPPTTTTTSLATMVVLNNNLGAFSSGGSYEEFMSGCYGYICF